MASHLAERRRQLVDQAIASNATVAKVFDTSPLAFGLDTLFYGNRRDIVRAVASTWASGTIDPVTCVAVGGRDGPSPVCDVPSHVYVTVSPACIEVDLDSASASEVRSILRWIHTKVQSRHVLNARHVVVIHAAEKVHDKSIARLQSLATTIVVLSSTVVDSQAVSSLSGFARIRVPCPPLDTIPNSVAAIMRPLAESMTVQSARDAVNRLARMGFDVAEISRFAWWTLLSGDISASVAFDEQRVDTETIAQLAHAAHGVSQLDRRALETLVVAIGSCNHH
jgi:hypothetical protein